MIFNQLGRTAPEKVFGVYVNNEGATLPTDAVVALENVAASVDGNLFVQPNTNGLDFVIGILDASVASTAQPQLVQIYGYRASALVYLSGTSYDTGIKLIPVAGANYLSSAAAGDGRDGLFALMQSVPTSATSTALGYKVLIRCM